MRPPIKQLGIKNFWRNRIFARKIIPTSKKTARLAMTRMGSKGKISSIECSP